MRTKLTALLVASSALVLPRAAFAADLILNGGTVTLGGTQTYGVVSLTNGAKVLVTPFNGTDKVNTGNLVIRANSITIDATSSISARAAGYQPGLCTDGRGPAAFPEAGGRGGCAVRDSAGGGAHFGRGGRGTKDNPGAFPGGYEENCGNSLNGAGTACNDMSDCRNSDGLPSVAGVPFFHSIYSAEFGASGGDKGCRDGDGFALWTNTTRAITGGAGGGRIVLFAGTAGQTGTLSIAGTVDADGARGCGAGNDSAGGGAGGSLLLIGDTVNIAATAKITAGGGRGGDTQPKPGDLDCVGTQLDSNANNCDDCGGGGGGGIIAVQSRVASIAPAATFNVSGALGGICPICTGEAGGGAGELQIDGAYVGEICDGFDNDFNGNVDDGLPQLNCGGALLPSCVNGIPQTCPAQVPACVGNVTDTRPRFTLVVDTSGSMLNDAGGRPTFGDGSVGHVGVDTASDADTVDGNNSRLYIAKRAISNVISAFPESDYALARYYQDVSVNRSCQTANWFECQQLCCSYDDPRSNVAPARNPACNLSTLYSTAGYPTALNANINAGWTNQADCINYAGTCGPPRRGGQVLVDFGKPIDQYLMWLDNKETNFNASVTQGDHCNFAGGGDCELRGAGPTPLAGSLQAVQDYLKPVIQCDGAVPCRKYATILLTDGAESCQGDPVAAATALRNSVPGTTVNTYVIGFSTLPSEAAQLNAIANAGGTGTAFFASDEQSLANALATIIGNSTVFEKCNGLDDDCDQLIDEDFPDKGLDCNDGKQGICRGFGKRICNVAQDGTTCQITAPGKAPTAEICNGLDDNCNGQVDEGINCQPCVPGPEICDGKDNDCNGLADDNPIGVGQACGTDVGACTAGLTKCQGGTLLCDGNVGPTAEICDGLDNDCDGLIDEAPPVGNLPGTGTPCGGAPGSCSSGVNKCIAGAISCAVSNQPKPETCNGRDDDCNGIIDDNPIDEGALCGNGSGACTPGKLTCVAQTPNDPTTDTLVCVGAVPPGVEICNGVDDDCDGLVDEDPDGDGPQVLLGVGDACGDATGCGAGFQACQSGQLTCVTGLNAAPEVCDGKDNDCNGVIDDNLTDIGALCGATIGACEPGTLQCVPTDAADLTTGVLTCVGGQGVTEEICDGLDNDCDGLVDENPETLPGVGKSCGGGDTGCAAAITACQAGVLKCLTSGSGKPETCNGLDDDCDGFIDNNPTDIGASCGNNVGACKPGTFQCVPVKPGDLTTDAIACVGGVGPSNEICDGLDNNCNGFIDENPDALPDVGKDCKVVGGNLTGACAQGKFICASGKLTCLSSAAVGIEICNGLDDDCDGVIDDNPTDIGGPCGSATGACEAGTFQCVATQQGNPATNLKKCVGATMGTPEICNNIDDDCNGVVDDGDLVGEAQDCVPPGLPAGTKLPLPGSCKPGKTSCFDGVLACLGGVGPGTETCNGRDDDCDGQIDDGATCPSGAQCVDGACSKPCKAGEFTGCPGGQECIGSFCRVPGGNGGAGGAAGSGTGGTAGKSGAGTGGKAGNGSGATSGGGAAGASAGGTNAGGGSAGATGLAGAAGSSGKGNVAGSTGAGATNGGSTAETETFGLATGGGGCSVGSSNERSGLAAGLCTLALLAVTARRRRAAGSKAVS